MNNASTILVGRIGDVFWLRVEGRGTFQNSVQVKTCFQQMMAGGMRNFVVDLERCPMMDSTFLGTLTGAALNLTELGEGRLSLLNANPRNQHLITSLGLDHILELDTDGRSWVDERRRAAAALQECCSEQAGTQSAKIAQAETVLEAHQALASVSEENSCRFHDVIKFLEQEMAEQIEKETPAQPK